MLIGIPGEIKNNEYRVSVTPGGVYELKKEGHKVYIEKNAGKGSVYKDIDYKEAGASTGHTL